MKRFVAIIAAAALLTYAPAFAGSNDWRARPPARGAHAMIATEQHYATEVGLNVLRRGGNAVDAAVAVAYTLAVVDPCCGNIGGGGFMLVRMHDGHKRFIDFREKAPLRATAGMYLDKNGNVVPHRSRKGYLAIGVPGTVMGLERARTELGTMSRQTLMAPAIALAQNGFRILPGDLTVFDGAPGEGYTALVRSDANVRAIFMPGGEPLHAGEMLRQTQLADTLRQISKGGTKAFYRGPIARAVVAASNRNGGILSLRDFASYTANEYAPIQCAYHGYTIISAPPPSSGGVTLCEILNILDPYPLAAWGWDSPRAAHYTIEAERRAYADRDAELGDPAFVHDPITVLLSPAYAAKRRSSIVPDAATPSVRVHPGLPDENNDTTHFSIVDAHGNAVAMTFTINDWFGAGVIAGNTGFFLNDEMDDFTSKPGVPNMFGLRQGKRNAIAAGKRPLSSMTPTIVTKDGKLFMVTGSPGGARIITIVLSTILNVLDYGMNVQQAVDAPRFHMQQYPDVVEYEPGAFTPATMGTLGGMGYRFKELPSWGSAQAVVVDQKTGIRYGGTDQSHAAGLAAGY